MTREYPSRFPGLRYRRFEDRDVCAIGLSACRERGDEDPAALLHAIERGCNVLDTAPQFHHLEHERCVGEAVRQAQAAGICPRESLVVNTQVGFVPDLIETTISKHGFGRVKEVVEERFIRPGIFAWADLAVGRHVMAPRYIRHSVGESLERMGLSYVDGVFLASPTIALRTMSQAQFERRVEAAFQTLEDLSSANRIRYYGVATSDAVDVDMVLRLVSGAAGRGSRFRALRVPFSLLRQDTRRLVDAAAELGLHVFASGCLDGGSPGYILPAELESQAGHHPDPAVAIQWVQSTPSVGTALIGSRDRRHIRANIAAAGLPLLEPTVYRTAMAA